MAPNILTSPLPAPFLPTLSLWEYVFPSGPGISPGPGPWPGSTTAYIDGLSGRSVTRAEVRDTALRLKGGLSARGVRRGDTAAIFGSNSIEWALAAWACLAAGVVVTPASSAFGASELAYQLNDSGATVLFVSPELVPVFEACRPALRGAFPAARVLVLAPPGAAPHPAYAGVHDACVGPGPACAPEPEAFDGVAAHSTAWLCYSSGTTGLPKGVQTTHHNLTTQFQTTPLLRPLPAHGADVVLGFLPFSHMYGIFAVVTTPVLAGVPAVILPRYDKRAALRAIETHRVTRFSAVPPVVLGLFDLGSLVEIRCAAAPMGAELAARFHARFPSCTVSQGYGMTEASPGITLPTPADDAAGRSGVGRLVPTYEARLVTASGADARPGEPGEMWVRGPNVMKGYHGNAEANAAAFAPGHWFRTGDVLRQDAHGAFHVVDRLKELIKYKGFQVPPAELESLLLGHPAVVDAGVVGVHDERQATELPRAYVVLAGSGGSGGGNSGGAAQTTTPDDIAHWVAARVAQYKRLRGGVVVTEQIPRGPTGKILRNALRDRAKKEWAADADARARL